VFTVLLTQPVTPLAEG